MNTEKMNNVDGESPENNYTNSKNESPYESISNSNNENNFNCIHTLISFIINLGLIIIAVVEIVIKKDCLIFNYLVDIFILFVFIFVIIYFFSRKSNYLKGFVYYPLCSLFWGIGDLLSIFYIEEPHNWCNSDTLKIAKISLIGLSLIINISYMKICNK